jgi:hypothetical protein
MSNNKGEPLMSDTGMMNKPEINEEIMLTPKAVAQVKAEGGKQYSRVPRSPSWRERRRMLGSLVCARV